MEKRRIVNLRIAEYRRAGVDEEIARAIAEAEWSCGIIKPLELGVEYVENWENF